MKICMVGEGAFANKHMDAIARIEGVEVGAICGGVASTTEAIANQRNIPFWTCLLYTSPSPRDATLSRMPSSA